MTSKPNVKRCSELFSSTYPHSHISPQKMVRRDKCPTFVAGSKGWRQKQCLMVRRLETVYDSLDILDFLISEEVRRTHENRYIQTCCSHEIESYVIQKHLCSLAYNLNGSDFKFLYDADSGCKDQYNFAMGRPTKCLLRHEVDVIAIAAKRRRSSID
jgi:hypothetical protein